MPAAYEDDAVKESSCVGCSRVGVGSLMLSLAGGVILIWWELRYQPTNQQQWMVPLGLILFLTPLFVCFSLSVSDLMCPAPAHTKINVNTDPEAGHPSSTCLES